MSTLGWYYLHRNGDLIFKRTEPEVEPGGFVRKVWPANVTDRGCAWKICIEALAMGADRTRVLYLKRLWNLTDEDAQEYARRANLQLTMDGDAFCATFADFDNLQNSPAGFGRTALEALAELAKNDLVAYEHRVLQALAHGANGTKE